MSFLNRLTYLFIQSQKHTIQTYGRTAYMQLGNIPIHNDIKYCFAAPIVERFFEIIAYHTQSNIVWKKEIKSKQYII